MGDAKLTQNVGPDASFMNFGRATKQAGFRKNRFFTAQMQPRDCLPLLIFIFGGQGNLQ
jgi:hypothetical protein